MSVSSIMLSEQTLLNAAVLTVDATSRNHELAGIVFNVLLIARAPLQLFQAIQTSLLPHLTGLEATEGHEAFARAIRVTILAIAAFAAAVALGLLILGPFVMRHVLRAALRLPPRRPRADRRRHGPAPDLRRAQPGGARTRPRARAAGCWLWPLRCSWRGCCTAIGDQLLRAEIGYAGATAVLALALAALYALFQRARDRGVGLAGLLRAEDRGARYEQARAGALTAWRGLRVDAPVDLDRDTLAHRCTHARQLRQRALDEGLPAPARVDGHA